MKKGKKFSSRPKTHRDRWARDTDRIDAHRKQIRATESRRDEGIGETVAYTKREHRSVVERHHENSSPKILEPILPRLVFNTISKTELIVYKRNVPSPSAAAREKSPSLRMMSKSRSLPAIRAKYRIGARSEKWAFNRFWNPGPDGVYGLSRCGRLSPSI